MNATTTEGTDPLPVYFSNIEILSMGVFTMLCAVGAIINSLVLFAFLRFRLYNSPSNLQLLSLVIDDLGTAILVEPLVTLSYLRPSLFVESGWLCRYFSTLLHIFPWGSTISILTLSSTRVLIVTRPFVYRSYVTCGTIFKAILAKYTFLFVFTLVSNFFWDTRFSLMHNQCFVQYSLHPNRGLFTETLVDKLTLPALHLIGGAVIFLINAVVVAELVKIKMLGVVSGRTNQVVNAGVELVLLVTVYMVTTISIPAIFITSLAGTQLSPQKTAMFAFAAKFLFYLQPIVNPLIYVIRRPEYRINMACTIKSTQRRPTGMEEQGRFYKTARKVIIGHRFIRTVRDKTSNRNKEGGGEVLEVLREELVLVTPRFKNGRIARENSRGRRTM